MTAQRLSDERTAGVVQSHSSWCAVAHQLVCDHTGSIRRKTRATYMTFLDILFDRYPCHL